MPIVIDDAVQSMQVEISVEHFTNTHKLASSGVANIWLLCRKLIANGHTDSALRLLDMLVSSQERYKYSEVRSHIVACMAHLGILPDGLPIAPRLLQNDAIPEVRSSRVRAITPNVIMNHLRAKGIADEHIKPAELWALTQLAEVGIAFIESIVDRIVKVQKVNPYWRFCDLENQ